MKVNSISSQPMRLKMDERQDKEYNQINSSERLREEPETNEAERQMSLQVCNNNLVLSLNME